MSTWGSIGCLLEAISPKCGCCGCPATRKAAVKDHPDLEEVHFCDEHSFAQWEEKTLQTLQEFAENRSCDPEALLAATFKDLPHAMPVRQLMGQVQDDETRYVLRVVSPEEQQMGDFLVLVHEKFVVVRVPATTTREDIDKAMSMTSRTTGEAEVLVVQDNVDIQVFGVVVPPSRYEQMRQGFGEDLDEGD